MYGRKSALDSERNKKAPSNLRLFYRELQLRMQFMYSVKDEQNLDRTSCCLKIFVRQISCSIRRLKEIPEYFQRK